MHINYLSVSEYDDIKKIIDTVSYKLSYTRMKQIIEFKYIMSYLPYELQIIIYALTINKFYNIFSVENPLITHRNKYDLRLKLLNYDNCKPHENLSGYIKIYNSMNIKTRNLLYKGFITNGQKGPRGIEYYPDNSSIKYEGGFNCNLYHGEGTLYYPNGLVKYIGEFEYGNPNGEGEEYSLEGHLHTIGEYLDGFIHGNDTEEYNTEGNLKYRGSYSYSKRDGYGIEFKECGNLKYRGYFKEGLYHGKGILFHNEINAVQYRGYFKNDLKDGYGMVYNENEQFMYEGEFTEGKITN